VAQEALKLRPIRSQEVRGSPELKKGGLRALAEAWQVAFTGAACEQFWVLPFLGARISRESPRAGATCEQFWVPPVLWARIACRSPRAGAACEKF